MITIAKRILTILFTILAFAGIIGLVIACLNVIPSGKGGSAFEEIINNLNNPAVTTPTPDGDQTTPSGANDETPDKVDPQGGRVEWYKTTLPLCNTATDFDFDINTEQFHQMHIYMNIFFAL